MEFRRATAEDVDRLVEIHFAAYPDGGWSATARRRNFTHNPLGALKDLVVVELGGDVVAHAFLFPLRASFGGRSVGVGGIASVGVAPEARGRGVATALMNHLHVLADARGDVMTMLYAFRHGFYARLGYATTTSRKRLSFDARSIPASWVALAKTRVRAARGRDRGPMRNVHARMVARSSGCITRPKAFWEVLLLRERRVLFVCERAEQASKSKRSSRAETSSVSGYVAFELLQEEDHGETTLEVTELVADDDESRRALLGSLATMRDQVSEIVLEVAESDPLERALIDPDGRRYGTHAVEHSLGEIVGGPMIRIEDIPRALEARGYEANGTFDVVVSQDEEKLDGAEAGGKDLIAVGVRVRDGRAEVGPARGGGALHTNRAGLAAIFYGGLSVPEAVALGLAEVDSGIAQRIAAIARLPALAPMDAF